MFQRRDTSEKVFGRLVTAFDLCMLMYKEEGSTTRQAVREILKHNLFGLDIDKRAIF